MSTPKQAPEIRARGKISTLLGVAAVALVVGFSGGYFTAEQDGDDALFWCSW